MSVGQLIDLFLNRKLALISTVENIHQDGRDINARLKKKTFGLLRWNTDPSTQSCPDNETAAQQVLQSAF